MNATTGDPGPPRWAAALLLAVLAPLAPGCGSARGPAPAAPGLTEDERLHRAVLAHVLFRWQDERPRYVCVERQDPSPALLRSLANASAVPLQPCSAAPPSPTKLERRTSELPYVVFHVHRLTRTDAGHAVVVAGFACGALCGGRADYFCVRAADGSWRVDHVENEVEA